ncbi:enzymatic polyprotein endonuclease reverse-like protein, partial [Dinothrombium tinctorium]
FLELSEALIDCKEHSVKFLQALHDGHPSHVHSKEDIVIPKRSRKYIRVAVAKRNESTIGLITTSTKTYARHGLTLANSLVKLEKGETDVEVMNVHHFNTEAIEVNEGSVKINKSLTKEQKSILREFIKRHESRFGTRSSPVGRAKGPKFKIITEGYPVHKPPYRFSQQQRKEINKEIQRLIDKDVIEPSTSDKNGITMDNAKVKAIRNFQVPKNVKDVRSFVGLASYYRKFIPHFADIAEPLTRLKELLTSYPLLVHFKPGSLTKLRTDASGYGLGAVLLQDQGEGYKPEFLCESPICLLQGIDVLQKNDCYWKPIIEKLLAGEIVEGYDIQEGVLYKIIETSNGQKRLLCVPEVMISDTLYSYHDDPMCGHLGQNKTLARIKERFYWPRMIEDVKH